MIRGFWIKSRMTVLMRMVSSTIQQSTIQYPVIPDNGMQMERF